MSRMLTSDGPGAQSYAIAPVVLSHDGYVVWPHKERNGTIQFSTASLNGWEPDGVAVRNMADHSEYHDGYWGLWRMPNAPWLNGASVMAFSYGGLTVEVADNDVDGAYRRLVASVILPGGDAA